MCSRLVMECTRSRYQQSCHRDYQKLLLWFSSLAVVRFEKFRRAVSQQFNVHISLNELVWACVNYVKLGCGRVVETFELKFR